MAFLKSIEDLKDKLMSYRNPAVLSFQPVVKQALEWAADTIRDYPTTAEAKIRTRINILELKQGGPVGAITDAPRQTQINALKWVIDEYDIDHLDPLY